MYALSIGIGFRALGHRIREIAGFGQDLDHGRREMVENDRFYVPLGIGQRFKSIGA